MDTLKIKGKLEKILDAETGKSKSGKEWKKQSFVINTGDQYNPIVCFSLFGEDKINDNLNGLNIGDDITVLFNVSSREFNGKYYHSLEAWKIAKGDTNECKDGLNRSTEFEDKQEDMGDIPF